MGAHRIVVILDLTMFEMCAATVGRVEQTAAPLCNVALSDRIVDLKEGTKLGLGECGGSAEATRRGGMTTSAMGEGWVP